MLVVVGAVVLVVAPVVLVVLPAVVVVVLPAVVVVVAAVVVVVAAVVVVVAAGWQFAPAQPADAGCCAAMLAIEVWHATQLAASMAGAVV